MGTTTIAHVTDAHLGQKVLPGGKTGSDKMRYGDAPAEHKDNLKIVLDDVAERGISELVFGGDIGTQDSNQWFFDTVGTYHVNLRMVLGNHDLLAEVRRHYRGELIAGRDELYYAHDTGGFRHIHLDTSSNAVSDAQFHWLQQQLDSEKPLLLFVHHPVLAIDAALDRSGVALKGREKIRDALHAAKTDVSIFCGHYHMTDATTEGNIRQFSSPAISYLIKKQDTFAVDINSFGYRLIEIDGAEMTTKVVMFGTAAPPI
jgi:3',5'-cyclic-AMP phosphodiesterase